MLHEGRSGRVCTHQWVLLDILVEVCGPIGVVLELIKHGSGVNTQPACQHTTQIEANFFLGGGISFDVIALESVCALCSHASGFRWSPRVMVGACLQF